MTTIPFQILQKPAKSSYNREISGSSWTIIKDIVQAHKGEVKRVKNV